MQIVKTNQQSAEKISSQAVQALKAGGLVIYPTETCYGIAADATNKQAVEKLLDYKGFRKGKPISVAVSSQEMAEKYVEINKTARNLYKNFLPGPLTVVSQGKHKVVNKLESEKGTLGIRIPDHSLALKIIKQFGKPITSTSANISNKKTPYKIEDVLQTLTEKKKKLISLIIDADKLPKHQPSTVVETTLDQLEIVRQGKLDFSDLKHKEKQTNSAKETQKAAEQLLKENFKLIKSDYCLIFALQGKLGSGKTQFCKGLGSALNIKSKVKSPTYTLMHEYNYSLNNQSGVFYHLDTWRMESPEELKNLKIAEKIKPKNIIAIEWLEKAKKLLKELKEKSTTQVEIFWVEINYTDEKEKRLLKYTDE